MCKKRLFTRGALIFKTLSSKGFVCMRVLGGWILKGGIVFKNVPEKLVKVVVRDTYLQNTRVEFLQMNLDSTKL